MKFVEHGKRGDWEMEGEGGVNGNCKWNFGTWGLAAALNDYDSALMSHWGLILIISSQYEYGQLAVQIIDISCLGLYIAMLSLVN